MWLFIAMILSSQNTGVSVLAPGSFHGSELSEEIGTEWLGLCRNGSGWELKPVDVTLERRHDPMLDEDGEATGWRVFTHREKPLLYLRSDVFIRGPVFPVLLETELLSPGWVFSPGEGESVSAETSGVYYTRGDRSQKLSEVYENLYGEGVSVVWVGDLDGDGMNDLILNDCPHYAIYAGYRVFLSTMAEPGELLGEVAEFTAVSC